MMDFLRSLAPSRLSDTSRAVAVLPSRFESDMPLLHDNAERSETEEAFDLDASQSPHAPSRAAASRLTAERDAGEGMPGIRRSDRAIAPSARQPAAEGERQHLGSSEMQAPSRAGERASGGIAEAHIAPAFAADARPARDVSASRDPAPMPVRERLAPAASAMSAAPSRRAAPLSAAAVAQRAPLAREADTVVEVSIGRIEVLAVDQTKKEPARRTSARRQPSVALADYLNRGTDGAR